jgi:hypothetical protein
MSTSNRRDFIKISGAGLLAINAINPLNSLYAPLMSFPRKSPESQGVLSSGISDFINKANESGLEWNSFMLLRHGNVIAEGWWKPFNKDYKHTLYSLSKSFTSTAIGLLVGEGKISVEDQVIKFFPNDLPAEMSDHLKSLKIKHLLTMNVGHDKEPAVRDNVNQSWVKTFLEHPIVHEPSTHFLYNTPATYMLGAILHKVTGLTLEDYLQPRLFKPLNIVGYDWEKSPQGLNTAGYGLRIKTEDIAKLGQLYLQKGKWQGTQILSESWVNEATSKQTTSQAGDGDWSQGYGYQFWRCKPGFFRGDGAFGQFCMVMPDYDAVLAVTCESWNMQKNMTVIYETILPAMQKEKIAENANAQKALQTQLKMLELPVVRGVSNKTSAQKYNGKSYAIDKNPFDVNNISFALNNEGGTIKIKTPKGVQNIIFGMEKWKTNSNVKNPFPVQGRTHIASKIAATGTWLDEKSLQVNFKFVEAIHGDKLTFTFDDKNIHLALLNSISANTKNAPEKREPLKGTQV